MLKPDTPRAHVRDALEWAARPLARLLHRLHVTATALTLAGAVLGALAALLVVLGHLAAGGIVLAAGGVLDLLDGTLARNGHGATAFGGFLDSTLDRVGEGLVMAALVTHLALGGQAWLAGLAALTLFTGLLVSYTKARAEALGASAGTGLMTRPERLLILIGGLIAGLVPWALGLILVVSAVTVGQRVHAAWQALERTP